VRSETHFARHSRDGLIEGEPLFRHPIHNGFEYGKPAMTLVQVQTSRGDAHSLQGAKSADSEQQLARAGLGAAWCLVLGVERRPVAEGGGLVGVSVGVLVRGAVAAAVDQHG